MAISVNPLTYVITIPKADLTLLQSTPTEIRELNINTFRTWLNAWEDDPEGMPHPKTHNHNTEVTVGGLTLARVVSILAPYSITFEDGQYAVNLTGANTNVGDRINVNQVSVRSSNSAGMVTSQAIEYGEYNGGVTIKTTSTYSGAIYPVGTHRQPVNNLSDALAICSARGFDTLFIHGDLTLGETDVVDDFLIVGEGATINNYKTKITMINGCSTANVKFEDCLLIGKQGGEVYGKHCVVGDGTGETTDASQTISVVASAGTFTRSAGDYTADGFEADMFFKAPGLANNTGIYTIASVTALVITVLASEWSDLTDEAGDADEQLIEFKGVYNSHCEWSQCIMVGPVQMYIPSGYDWTSGHTTDSVNCRSGDDWFELDFGPGAGFHQNYNDFSGHIKIINVTKAGADIKIHMDHGHVWVDSTCTAGTIEIKGIGEVTDDSTGLTVITTALLNTNTIADAVWDENITTHTNANSTGKKLADIPDELTFTI